MKSIGLRGFSPALVAVLASTALLCSIGAAHAQNFTFTLAPATKTGTAGQTVTFQGTFANNTASTMFVNGLDIFFTGTTQAGTIASPAPALTLPRSIAANSTYFGDIFQVLIAGDETNFPITGNVTAQGGSDTDALIALAAAQNFTVVAPVVIPESNTALFVGLALPLLGVAVLSPDAQHRRLICTV